MPWLPARFRPALQTVFGRRRTGPTAQIKPVASSPAGSAFAQRVAALSGLLPSRSPRVVAILTAEPGPVCDDLIGGIFGADRVILVVPSAAPPPARAHENLRLVRANALDEVESELLKAGPIDMIVNLRPVLLDDLVEALLRLFLHLRRGGVYLLDRRSLHRRPDWPKLTRLLESVDLKKTGAVAGAQTAEERELVGSVKAMVLTPYLLLLSKATTHYVKLTDTDAVELLGQRSDRLRVRVLERRPAASFRSRAVVRHYGPAERRPSIPEVIEYPALTARLYRGRVTMASHSLLFTSQVLLPESFRYHRAVNLINGKQIDVNERFARIPAKHMPRRVLPGRYFHVDAAVPGHFGHVMTEVLSRLWAWDEAKAAYPDLKAIHRLSSRSDRHQVDRVALRAYGIADSDIVSTDRPVTLKSVIGCTPMWHHQRPYSVHPGIESTWQRMRANLVDPSFRGSSRIFVSRPAESKNRPCRNTFEVEEYFASRGFRVVHPERHTFEEQANIFAAAEVIAGFGGSALFNILFCESLSKLIILTHLGYRALNEYLFASLLGCEVHYVWSLPDIVHPARRWIPEAYQSPWAFDFATHRPTLDGLTQ